jgi:hypothetical protein
MNVNFAPAQPPSPKSQETPDPPDAISDEKGETAIFSKILTIFYDYGSIP